MGFINELKKLTKPYSGEEYDDFGDEIPETPAETSVPPVEPPRKYSAPPERKNPFSEIDSRQSPTVRKDKVVNLSPQTQVQMVLVKPERFETAAEIADHLRDRRPVFVNLEQTQKDTARRLIDFLSGVAYALDGKIRKVSVSTFVITPYNVEIMGDMLDEYESSNLY